MPVAPKPWTGSLKDIVVKESVPGTNQHFKVAVPSVPKYRKAVSLTVQGECYCWLYQFLCHASLAADPIAAYRWTCHGSMPSACRNIPLKPVK